MTRHFLRGLLLAAACAAAARADDSTASGPPAPNEPPPPAVPAEPVVGTIVGDRVNLRVGPRIDHRAVAQLADGTVLVVVERLQEWVGVRIPAGFPAAISMEFAEEVGVDAVRVTAGDVNLRLEPPTEGKTLPTAFRDKPARGAVLTLISREGSWAWVVAPEEVRAYVSARYVKELGPLSAQGEVVAAARAKRETEAKRLALARQGQQSEVAGLALKAAVGEIQEALYRMRVEGNKDKAPVIELCDRLDRALEVGAASPPRVMVLAKALRDDLEAEIALAVARHDAEVARLRHLPGKAVPTPAPKVESVLLAGQIRYEETPGWKDPGVHFLWIDDRPAFVLRLTTGGPLPHPDLTKACDGKPHAIEGAQSGDRLFGLPVIEVRALRDVAETPAPPR